MASNKNFKLAFEIGGKVAASLPKVLLQLIRLLLN